MTDQWRAQYDASRDLSTKAVRSACYAPYASLEFHPDGSVRVCCQNQGAGVGRIPEQTIHEIWNGSAIQTLRESLSAYRFDNGCERCLWQIQRGVSNPVPKMMYDSFAVKAKNDWPKKMAFRLHNTCNLGCIMCEPYASSVITKERGLPQFPRKYGEAFFKELEAFIPHLVSAEFSGGEPFLISEHYRVLDMMIALNRNVDIFVTTNGTVMNQRIEMYLSQLRFSSITVSIDAVTKQRFEDIRRGASFDQVIDNTRAFSQYARQHPETILCISFCAMRQNWDQFADLLLLAEELDAKVILQMVTFPAECTLYTLPQEKRNEIRDSLERDFKRIQSYVRPKNLTCLRDLMLAMERVGSDEEKKWPTVFKT